jgi:uncharacterized membrane protein YfcA
MSALPDPHLLITILLAALFGGIVRGYSGFGFALAAMPILTIAMSPVQAVPVVFPLEFAIGVLTLPMECRSVDLRVLKWLALGALLGTPIGVTVVALLPTEWTRLLLGLAVGAAVIRAWKQETTPTAQKDTKLAAIGFLSGCLNGGTGMSGPPVIVSLLGSEMPMHKARATLIAFIAMSAGFGIAISVFNHAYSGDILLTSLIMSPAVALGCGLGVVAFSWGPKHLYRPISLSLLALSMVIAIGVAGVAVVGKLASLTSS